jgi:hypothetical protein
VGIRKEERYGKKALRQVIIHFVNLYVFDICSNKYINMYIYIQ